MKRVLAAILCFVTLTAFSHPSRACITRSLTAPEAVEAYLKNPVTKTYNPVAPLAESFQRDKAYYDATVLEYCSLRAGLNSATDEALASADRRVMDLLLDKWAKIAAAAAAPQTRTCATPDDCKDFCKGAGVNRECMPDGIPVCSKGQCSCGLTCR